MKRAGRRGKEKVLDSEEVLDSEVFSMIYPTNLLHIYSCKAKGVVFTDYISTWWT